MRKNHFEVLLVEDNLHDITLTLDIFRRHQLASQVHVVRDGAEALEFVFCSGLYASRTLTEQPGLVLLDLKLPRVGGLEVVRQMKSDARTRNIPIVVLTTSREDRDIMESYRLGVNSYIVKPVDFEEFDDVVRQLGRYWLLLNESPRR